MDMNIEQVYDGGLLCSEVTLRSILTDVTNEFNDRSARLLSSIGTSDELAEGVEHLLMDELTETDEYNALLKKRDELLREFLLKELFA